MGIRGAYCADAPDSNRWGRRRCCADRPGRPGWKDSAVRVTSWRRLADVSPRLRGTGYSPLAQINSKNVASLREVWSYRVAGDNPNSQATPIVVNGVMYLPAANRVVALDPETGTERWSHAVEGVVPSRRGVAYWSDEGGTSRIIFMAGRRLIALEAGTGNRATGFGTNGEVDVVVPYNSVPVVYRNVVLVGANNPPGSGGAPGNARAFDARNGAKLWELSSVAQPGSPGHDTWDRR